MSNNNNNNNNPFGNPTVYTNPAAIFRAYVQIDNVAAGEGDTVAIYIGEELRCVQTVQIAGSVAIIAGNVEMGSGTETITKIEIWDASEDLVLEVPNFTLEVSSGVPTDLLTINAITSSAPFGNPIVYTNPAAIFRAYVQINSVAAGEGDTVAIYIGEELRCVQTVQIVGSVAIIAGNIEMGSSTETITKIEIWDASEDLVLEVPNFTLEVSSGVPTDLITINAITDFEAPLITLIGNASILHELNTTYTDEGAIASDNLDGDLTNSIIVQNNVNDSVPGSYSVTYNVSDSAGNNAVEIVRTVLVQDTIMPVITLIGNASILHEAGTTYTDEGAIASDNLDGDLTNSIIVQNNVNDSVPGSYSVTYNVSDSAGNNAVEIVRTVEVNTKPVINDLIFLEYDGTSKVYSFTVIDDDTLSVLVNNLPECWVEYKLDNGIHKIVTNPGVNNIGSYNFEVVVNDGNWGNISKELSFDITVEDVGDRYSFCENNYTDISSVFNNFSLVESGKLRFISVDTITTSITVSGGIQSETAKVINLDLDGVPDSLDSFPNGSPPNPPSSLNDKEIELELIVNFDPIFLKYSELNLVKLVEMSELSSFEPSRWAKEESNSYRLVFQGYMRDLHINNGCIQDEFNSGVCEDPHVLTFGGNRLDLPYDEKIYSMINGLGLKINIKSQMIGDGSYAKYFYVNYDNEEFILDIDNLELKDNSGDIETKYHMLIPSDYSGYKFTFEKKMRSLNVKSTDGVMELLFNAETRGLLIKSRLNFTQENSSGILMSNYLEDCLIEKLDE